MSGLDTTLEAHLATGLTTTCRCWALTRRDGLVLGFTDHDCSLEFDAIAFKADTGLTALALQQSTGLSVDNTEALGALSDLAIREDDIEAGRFDGAEIRAWIVNWSNVSQRHLQFRGTLGEIRRANGAFEAELRGLTDLLNRPLGRVYQKPCSAVLGDRGCRVDMTAPGYRFKTSARHIEDRRIFHFDLFSGYEPSWFQHGSLIVNSGQAKGLTGVIKRDHSDATTRTIELWHPIRAGIETDDGLTLLAGCDKRVETCRTKFNNLLNFQGFPDIPGDDWTLSDPSKAGNLSGGSRRS